MMRAISTTRSTSSELTGGGWHLGVHIADVSAYVTPGSALDREALKRGNSVYLPDRVIPMLPERLSNGVCSLNPRVDRLTHSVFIQFGKDGGHEERAFRPNRHPQRAPPDLPRSLRDSAGAA